MTEEATLGERIRRLRQLRGLTQRQLSKMIGASKMSVWDWENTGRSPSAYHIVPLCRALRVSPNKLLGWKREE